MDIRAQASLIGSLLSLAFAMSVMLRAGRRRERWTFAGFGGTLAIWYLTVFLDRLLVGDIWHRVCLAASVLVPLSAARFFQAFLAEGHGGFPKLNRSALIGAVLLWSAMASPIFDSPLVGALLVSYLALFLGIPIGQLFLHARRVDSRFQAAKIRFLGLVGALATVFAIVDYLPLVGVNIPPVGTLLVLLFLYVLSQSIVSYRLLDLYELAGRLGVLTALCFALAGVVWGLTEVLGGDSAVPVVAASGVFLLLLQPLSSRVEERIAQVFFRDRYDFEKRMLDLRQRLAVILDLDSLREVLFAGFERTRRVTDTALYLADPEGHGFDLLGHLGHSPPARVERASARPLVTALEEEEVLVIEHLRRRLAEHRESRREREAESLYEIIAAMEALQTAICIAIQTREGELSGMLCVRDARMRDAFTAEEVNLLKGIAYQTSVGMQNSRLYERMKQRDRLAVLGEMSAGLAHEIRNPLGSIKASAQYLADEGMAEDVESSREFLGIIVEEVDRLNRVVSSFLDYVNPQGRDVEPCAVDSVVARTMQLLSTECVEASVEVEIDIEEQLPACDMGAEQLRQVLINLAKNAIQAMEAGGCLRVTARRGRRRLGTRSSRECIEIRVSDTGAGIPQTVLNSLFVPFVTTKDKGTGLGLAISQRLTHAVGGEISVRSKSDKGTTFVIRIPIAAPAEAPALLEH